MDLHSLTHLLLSFSLFSFVISYSTSYSCLIHSFKFYFSTLFSHILGKNCIFLIFNGILVFLAKTSGVIRFSNVKPELNEPALSSFAGKKVLVENIGANEENQDLNIVWEEKAIIFVEKEVLVENIRADEENQDLNLVLEEKAIVVELEDELKGGKRGDVYNVHDIEDYELDSVTINNQEEETEEDDNDLLSSEDLNKKFDNFIKRMKEEFRIEAHQQLVAYLGVEQKF